MSKQKRNPHRAVILRLADAAAIHRMLEYFYDKRMFDNPIIAYESEQACKAAKERLGDKLIANFQSGTPR